MYGTVSSLLDTCGGCLQGSVSLQLVGLQWFNAVFLKLGSEELGVPKRGVRWFRETKMCNGGRVLLAVLNLCVRITVRLATFGTNHYVTDSTLTVNRCCSPEAS